MPAELAYVITAIAVLIGVGATSTIIEQARGRARAQATGELLAYLGISRGNYEDSRLALWDQIGLVEDALISEAHRKTERGLYLADKLLEAGAITIAKRNEARKFFLPYLTQKDRKTAMPEQLPDLGIEAHCDRDAYWAEQQWLTFVCDCAVLRYHMTATFAAAFQYHYIDRGNG